MTVSRTAGFPGRGVAARRGSVRGLMAVVLVVLVVMAGGSLPGTGVPAQAAQAPSLPTGTGMWLHEWERSEGGRARDVVARAERVGLSHVFVQTGSSHQGWIGDRVLAELLPAAERTGLQVIAWDFPELEDPEADALRMARAATWTRDGLRVTAVAPDVETAAEGTRATGERVRRYYAALREALPPGVAVLATVPWPSEKRTGSYPYAETAPFIDAWIPMAYWYNRDPATVTTTSVRWLGQFGKPVMPVGQGFDGRIDAPWLPADPAPGASVEAFIEAAVDAGAPAVSLWSWQTTGPQQWEALSGVGGRGALRGDPPPRGLLSWFGATVLPD